MSELRPVINPPRDLATPGRLLRSALALFDHVNPFLAFSQPQELEFDELARAGQVAGLVHMEETMRDGLNAQRRAAWRAAYGGEEPTGPILGVPMPNIETAMANIAKALNAEKPPAATLHQITAKKKAAG